ncbi:uncharacterized protein LOC132947205 isoform X2 [Metopolophium dirhodum]|uniref:uncharacterized protein LOC132947205 isoform X2 n=1 Tax=Metopolophium dirhodum TaxID=44670 RepID=UPI00298FF852|nr:uncharacterized protein LOC132947205 isoform X2 [Metopolophium dirhodum]
MDEEDFKFKYNSEEDFNRAYKKVIRCRQKQMDDQHWNIYMESINDTDSKKTFTIENNTEVKQSEHLFNKGSNSQFSTDDSVNLRSLHDPSDLNNIHGLRNRLFITFNAFSKILENALSPPVLKSAKKKQIKIKECDQLPNNYICDLNSLLSEIKKESKNEDLHGKKNKNNVTLRKSFQIKLIKCYKLAINATKECSKTLEAGIYNPIQSKMKNLIQIISTLSLTTGKYIYGELYKKKKKESFDLVQHCKDLDNMLEESGYKDTDDDNHSNNMDNNILNELSKIALSKPAKTQPFSANSNRLSMYSHDQPKLGSCYAQGWSKKSFELTRNKVLSKKDNIIKTENNLDDVKTVMEEYPFRESNETNNKLFIKEIQNEKIIDTNEAIKFPTASKVLKSDNSKRSENSNVGLYYVRHNPWKNFPIKNIRLSKDNEQILLNISQKDAEEAHSDRRKFKEYKLRTERDDNIVSKITELVLQDLINEVLTKIFDAIIFETIRREFIVMHCIV